MISIDNSRKKSRKQQRTCTRAPLQLLRFRNAAQLLNSLIQLLKNKTVLVGKRVKRFIPARGGVIGNVLRYSVERDAYLVSYGNGEHEVLTFDDMLQLLPKSWKRREAEANLAVCMRT
jgi:hypothetical protein